jgi:indolepyruvate ferredoxin oxidoreductase beta subunit
MEQLEALRWLDYPKPEGAIVYNLQQIPPSGTVFGDDVYPDPDTVRQRLEAAVEQVVAIDATGIAQELGHLRVANVVMLGALSRLVAGVDESLWQAGVAERVPRKALDLNLQAFARGAEQVGETLAV